MDILSFALADFSDLWSNWLSQILLLIVGLGLVIFVHELGHFLTAKAVGIRVSRFSIGFGPKVWGFTRGETEYWLSALPLGGYVKMPGQEDFKPQAGETTDPRAFNNKPIWARLLVVSAGVVMNVILAGIFFIIVCLMGIRQPAPVVASVPAGFPAASAQTTWDDPIPVPLPATTQSSSQPATASLPSTSSAKQPTTMATQTVGLQPGDKVLALDGDPVSDWLGIAVEAAVARTDQVFDITIAREIGDTTYIGHAKCGVKVDKRSGFLSFGIGEPPVDTVFGREIRVDDTHTIQAGDRLVKINDKEIRHIWDLDAAMKDVPGFDAVLTVQRKAGEEKIPVRLELLGGNIWKKDAKTPTNIVRLDAIVVRQTDDEVVIEDREHKQETLKATDVRFINPDEGRLAILGLLPRVRIAEVAQGGAAEAAGLKAGDIIIRYGDQSVATHKQLVDTNKQYAEKGTNIIVERDGKTLAPIWIIPRKDNDLALIGIAESVDSAHPMIGGVQPWSPLLKEVMPGDAIKSVNGRPIRDWGDFYQGLLESAGHDVSLVLTRNGQEVTIAVGKLDKWKFDPETYIKDLPAKVQVFQALEVLIQSNNPVEAIKWGSRQTRKITLNTYAQLRGLFTGTIPVSELRSFLGIGSAAVVVGRKGLSNFIYLMAIISISLAVVNFLPIPVVDGGLAVMLIIEKIRGKPAPIKVVTIIQYIGLALLLCVFLFATWSDINRWIHKKW